MKKAGSVWFTRSDPLPVLSLTSQTAANDLGLSSDEALCPHFRICSKVSGQKVTIGSAPHIEGGKFREFGTI